MAHNAEVIKKGNENNTSLLRRFTRRVQSSSVLSSARKHRYYQRPLSKQLTKQKRLEKLERRAKIEWLVKLGKIGEKTENRRR
ncbi:MAG: 30S ribosomal protein S21 [Candidatus Paceibacterota bacterium]